MKALSSSYGCVQQADSYVINLYCEIDGKRIHVRTQSSPNHSGMSATADGINYMVTERGAAVVMNQETPYTGRISVAESIEYGDDSHDVTIIDDNAFNNFYGSDISSIELPRTLVVAIDFAVKVYHIGISLLHTAVRLGVGAVEGDVSFAVEFYFRGVRPCPKALPT